MRQNFIIALLLVFILAFGSAIAFAQSPLLPEKTVIDTKNTGGAVTPAASSQRNYTWFWCGWHFWGNPALFIPWNGLLEADNFYGRNNHACSCFRNYIAGNVRIFRPSKY